MQLKGKKILILGANPTEIFIVQRAKALGIYTIVTDNHQDWTLAPAKYVADEAWNLSWSDLDALEEKCKNENIDGILAGFSEFRVDNMIKLCERLDKPCYITAEQLETTRDKIKFKECCKKYGVPTVPQYDPYSSNMEFPVIVKPVDRAGSIGIAVCYDKLSYDKALEYALSVSPSRQVIVEKYLGGEMKFDVYYCVQDGIPVFWGSNDTLMCPPKQGLEILQSAWMFPSKDESILKSKLDAPISNMLRGLGINFGYITISGFIDKNKNVYVFETGFRLSGELSFMYSEYEYNANYIDLFIQVALTGKAIKHDYNNRQRNGKLLVVNYYSLEGEIAEKKIEPKSKDCKIVDYVINSKSIEKTSTLLPKKGMLFDFGKTSDDVIDIYKKNYDSFDIISSIYGSLVYYRPAIDLLSDYYAETYKESVKTVMGGGGENPL